MPLILLFVLGIANFALHRAVLASNHPVIRDSAWFTKALGGKATLLTEFVVLLAAMLAAANGYGSIVWVYAGYTLLNGLAAWLILSRRV
ncbi:hypothetical protein [Parerythrobacter aestuarii]|uniref:hypothetical protein n=1 Tax=Parerythrobacter aestuarii TaxID=3020909 RepID=UPI0024DEA3A9|nr:hypothetical protein [Parerythrobacter aestuarii]